MRKRRYDGRGRLFESETPDPDDAGSGQPLVTRFLYADNEHLSRVQTWRGGVILTDVEYTDDDLGQLDLEIGPGSIWLNET